MNIIYSVVICFSMYSAIPMPKVNWEKQNMKYVFCFLPLVGIIIGLLQYFWLYYSVSFNNILVGAVATVIPVIVTGGLHIDGFIDSCDAFFSYGDKQKKLDILKDPHVGAFGVIYCIVYFIIMLGVFSELVLITPLIFIFAISRTVASLITIHWRSSKSSGLKYIFSENTSKKLVTCVLLLWLFILFICVAFVNIFVFIIILISLSLFYIWFYFFITKNFDGLTGDLVGFSLCMAELIMLVDIMIIL